MHTQLPLQPLPAQTPFASRHRSFLLLIVIFSLFVVLLLNSRGSAANSIGLQATPSPTPSIDRLAAPVMPAVPTAIDLGRMVYYLNCTPCHGDRGQGLTDEWRALYEEHQNCWARGCHGGRIEDEGFPVPHTVPAIIGAPPISTRFQTADDLIDYLKRTHPPQRPGVLSDDEYRNVTAFLWSALGRSSAEADQAGAPIGWLIPIGLVLALIIFVIVKRPRSRSI